MIVDYDHDRNPHTLSGAAAALATLFGKHLPVSVLDVGCGTGTWLRAAADLGIVDLCGIDGVSLPPEKLHVPKELIRQHDLSKSFHLDRKFDVALCLEVAEHLPESSAEQLISSIVEHADTVLFSAACPGQLGQHHVHCRWPSYWQELFNARGFTCDDAIRWQIWDDERVEPWYRQNIFTAKRRPLEIGEPRMKSVIHPAIQSTMYIDPNIQRAIYDDTLESVESGMQPVSWYLSKLPRAIFSKMMRKLR